MLRPWMVGWSDGRDKHFVTKLATKRKTWDSHDDNRVVEVAVHAK